MNANENFVPERLFEVLKDNWCLREEISAFSKYLKTSSWIVLKDLPHGYSEFKKTDLFPVVKKSVRDTHRYRSEANKILRGIKKSVKEQALCEFAYNDKLFGVSYPLMVDSSVFGVIVLCGLKKSMHPDLKGIFTAFTAAVIRESQKEIELEEVNKTIRPRAVALSTVHTVHRLMTSTLNLNELLPMIARVAMQIIRANRCSIKLVDKKKQTLIPKCTIDARKQQTKLKKVVIGKYAPGRAVKKATPIRDKNFLATPLIDEEVVGVITLYDKLDGQGFSAFDEEIMKTLGEQSAIAIKNAQLFHEQVDLTTCSIKCIAQLLEARPHGGHRPEASTFKLISIIGRKFDMNESETKMLQYAAMLHDAGQLSIPEKVLTKRGELTGGELDIIKKHPRKGANILAKFKPLKPIVPIILYHHENFDGTGYPKGLKKNEIPLSARILGVVASFEAMIIEKPYRKALSIPAAVKEVKRNSGTQFDPQVVKVFCDAVDRRDVKKALQKELGR